MTNLDDIIKKVIKTAISTGAFLRKEVENIKSSDIELKGIHNFVTYVDKEAEQKIVSELKSILPQAGFIVEEQTETKKADKYNWIVDPLDGTTNFIHQLPCFSISIALMKDDEIILGVVYEINQDECFSAIKDGGAFMNGKKISVSKAKTLNDSLLATGFPYYDYSRIDNYIELFIWFLRNTHGVRRFGSAAVDLAYVACGRFDGFFEYSLNPWDVAAGSLIVKEAGGKVADFKGENDYLFGKEIVAANSNIFEDFIQRVKSGF
ncbi:MAG: inositol monophosphatase family protein [Bacteroidales bacterium]